MIYFVLALIFSFSQCNGYTVGIIGDSISVPHPVRNEDGWPFLLQEKYQWKIINYSIGSSSTESLVSRLLDLIENHDPDLIIITLGICDSLYQMPIEKTFFNFSQAIHICNKSKIKVMMGSVDINYLQWHGKEYSQNFSKMFNTLKRIFSSNIIIFPFLTYEIEEKYCIEDHFHPNEQGHIIISDAISKYEKFWK